MSKGIKFGIFLSVQHPVGDSLTQRFQEAMEQLRLAREVGIDLVCTGQHYLSTPYQALQSIPLLARASAESGGHARRGYGHPAAFVQPGGPG